MFPKEWLYFQRSLCHGDLTTKVMNWIYAPAPVSGRHTINVGVSLECSYVCCLGNLSFAITGLGRRGRCHDPSAGPFGLAAWLALTAAEFSFPDLAIGCY